MATQPADYCREIETYLCRKNDGHLIRVVGPSFELVLHWERQGIPLKIAFQGIDRYFERYYRRGPRRRPVKVDFCEADVLDVFDEWRRAVGLARAVDASDAASDGAVGERAAESLALRVKRSSLPEHLERVVESRHRLEKARARVPFHPRATGARAKGCIAAVRRQGRRRPRTATTSPAAPRRTEST